MKCSKNSIYNRPKLYILTACYKASNLYITNAFTNTTFIEFIVNAQFNLRTNRFCSQNFGQKNEEEFFLCFDLYKKQSLFSKFFFGMKFL